MIDQATVASYNDLLARIGQTTDELSGAVREMRLPDIDHLLSVRQNLCTELISVHRRLQEADPELHCLTPQTRSQEQSLLAKQSACEVAMSTQLQESRRRLAELRQKKGLKRVYGPAQPAQSRFLDNRI